MSTKKDTTTLCPNGHHVHQVTALPGGHVQWCGVCGALDIGEGGEFLVPYRTNPDTQDAPGATEDSSTVLALPMDDENDAGAATIREYLCALVQTLWREGEDFGGKRPFGHSGWEFDLYMPLIKAGLVTATLDEEGWIDEISTAETAKADRIIAGAIDALSAPTRFEALVARGREIAQLEGGEIEVREEEDSGTLETTIFVRVWQQPRQPFDPLALAAFYIEEESEPAPARSKLEEDDLGLEIGGVP